MKKIFVCLAVLWSCSSFADPVPSRWDGLSPAVSGSSIEFQSLPGREKVPTLNLAPLKEISLVSWLRPAIEATPYLLLSAVAPDTSERSLYVVRADGRSKPQRMTYPGKLLDPKTRETVHESRAFFGRCLTQQEHDVLVLYQRDRIDRKHKMHSSLYVAEASPNILTERIVERRLPSISSLQMRVRSRQCSEIEGKNRLFDASFFQFRNRGADLPDDEEDDEKESEKENEKEGGKSEGSSEKAQYETTDARRLRLEPLERLTLKVRGT